MRRDGAIQRGWPGQTAANACGCRAQRRPLIVRVLLSPGRHSASLPEHLCSLGTGSRLSAPTYSSLVAWLCQVSRVAASRRRSCMIGHMTMALRMSIYDPAVSAADDERLHPAPHIADSSAASDGTPSPYPSAMKYFGETLSQRLGRYERCLISPCGPFRHAG